MTSNLNEKNIYALPNWVRIIINDDIIDNNILEWHKEHGELYLTLGEISDQLSEKGYRCVISVWEETPLEGYIYEYDNNEWIQHGKTRGYA
ncbi:hypothetical protein HYH38_16025 [Clostridium botulinum]|uniref:hypothetical protein n=1 Tax=Clostridium botulinum TaxID=1491 RepID=UPI00155DC905|nr:hypothetical protein [Clostridium botulinum]MBY6810971.1 hypothetical protein [Clostridium botulinum]MBY6818448.1 hypothetical protein [Clostridium botulinum]MBY6824439.1 hypothetical protein [Clostridium botulinum]MBY6828742.1 hypothetical protein [Clostridium botulinum]MBY6832671.1 hypothetical protein [Clostridium botulinum]